MIAFYLIKIGKQNYISAFENVWSFQYMPIIQLAAKLCGAKSIARISGIYGKSKINDGAIKKLLKFLYLKYEVVSLNMCDKVHVLSKSLASEYSSRGIYKSKLKIISQGVNTDRYSFSKKPNDRFKLLVFSRLEKIKSVHLTIEALRILRDKNITGFELTIAGDGSCRQDLLELTSKYNLNDHITFIGYVDHADSPQLYSEHDALIITSSMEGLPNTVLESQASGLPVIGSNVGEIPTLLNNNCGLILQDNTPDEIAKTIRFLLDNPNQRLILAKNARLYVEQFHSYDTLSSNYLNMYQY